VSADSPEPLEVSTDVAGDRSALASRRLGSKLPEPSARAPLLSDTDLVGHLCEIGCSSNEAAELLESFGTLSGVLSAPLHRLASAVGPDRAAKIRGCRNLMRAALSENLSKGPALRDQKAIFELLRFEIGARACERLIAIYLDCGFHVLRIARISDGTPRSTHFPFSKIIHIGLDVGAAEIIVVHNHPSGDCRPSADDRRAIAKLSWLAHDLDMNLFDSWIVAGDSVCSILK
jgi:DNA repair protein RadC